MALSFKQAPLIELMAELRWKPEDSGTPAPALGFFQSAFMNPAIEEFLMRFGAEIYQRGYDKSERIFPPGMVAPPFQSMCRYRSMAEGRQSTLFQAGLGVFTANAVPPYRSWAVFGPIVEEGVAALLKARVGSEHESNFTSAVVRYVNLFREPLVDGRSVAKFVQEVLGFGIKLPEVIYSYLRDGAEFVPAFNFQIPLAKQMQMSLSFGDGQTGVGAGLIMDISVSSDLPIAPDVSSAMNILDEIHGIIHNVFLNMTNPILELMEPRESE